MRSALFLALACLLVCTATASGKDVASLSELSLKDEISLQDMIAAQNAEEAPLRVRRLMGIRNGSLRYLLHECRATMH